MRTIQVDVSYNTKSGCAAAIGSVVFLLLGYAVIATLLEGRDISTDDQVKLAVFGVFGLVWFIIPLNNAALKKTHVRTFDANGVTTYGGRTFPWSTFQQLQELRAVRSGTSHMTGFNLIFAAGAARIEYKMVRNPQVFGQVIQALAVRDFNALMACFAA